MASLNLPRGYSVGTWKQGFVFTWVEVAVVPIADASDPYRGGVTITQRAGRMSDVYPSPEEAARAAREHASLQGA